MRSSVVAEVMQSLRVDAAAMAAAVSCNDTLAVGACLSQYWSHKKVLAAGAEPPEVCMVFFCRKQVVARAHGIKSVRVCEWQY